MELAARETKGSSSFGRELQTSDLGKGLVPLAQDDAIPPFHAAGVGMVMNMTQLFGIVNDPSGSAGLRGAEAKRSDLAHRDPFVRMLSHRQL